MVHLQAAAAWRVRRAVSRARAASLTHILEEKAELLGLLGSGV